MIFTETPLAGAYIIDLEPRTDHRGFFARIWCQDEMAQHGLKGEIVQSNLGFSLKKGTLRGLHFQTAPYAEVKTVRCTRGAVYDVIVDLRPDSKTYKQWFGIELTPDNHKAIYVPEGFAQGWLALTDNSEIYYHTTQRYAPSAASGIRYDDPAFGIEWPIPITVISDQDRSWPDYDSRADQIVF